MTVADRVALVTGGGSGIGRATALQLADRGDRVVVADLDATAAETVAGEITGRGGVAHAVAVDVTDPDRVEAMVTAAVDMYGRLDVAVNSAGVPSRMALIADLPFDLWQQTLAVNLTGVFLSVRAEIRALLASGGGAIVNVASAAGMMGVPGMAAYSASKHGVIGVTKSAALECARQNIRVNAVLPGSVRTPMLEGFTGGNEDALTALGKMQPLGRLATPDEIAAAIVWLCSDAASFVTGHAMAVDGGVLAT